MKLIPSSLSLLPLFLVSAVASAESVHEGCGPGSEEPVVASAESTLEGRWHTPKQKGTVEITIEGGVLRGTLVESSDRRAKIGLVILREFTKQGATWAGTIYVPKRDKTLDAELIPKGGELEIRVSAGRSTKSVIWTRAQ